MQQVHLAAGSAHFCSPVCPESRSLRRVARFYTPRRACYTSSASATQTADGSATSSHVDVDSPFKLEDHTIDAYRRNGFVKIPKVFDEPTLTHYISDMSLEVAEADKTPLQKDLDYQQAFTQVQNLWQKNDRVLEFVRGQRLARIAAELMGVEGVRFYADQALNKEPHGGYTPWHCDAFYWPLASDKAVTAWIPLQVR
ncbi:hypothetical protein ABBQ32_004915 [Trebouxia sp. C0010 RCD-2024]